MTVSVRYLIVAGGGGGGSDHGGGGGAGGLLAGTVSKAEGTSYTITVGTGGAGGSYPTDGTNGTDSVFDNLTATGGGRGQTQTIGTGGASGGSGGGGNGGPGYLPGGSGTSGQGNAGGYGSGTDPSGYGRGGGGGGAGAIGDDAGTTGGDGGDGVQNDITGTNTYYAGGGGGGSFNSGAGGQGGLGGGGNGGGTSNNSGQNGTDGLGGGGGGASNDTGGTRDIGGNGGNGVVILRFASSTPTPTVTGGPTITTVGSDKVYKWTASGSITFVSTVNVTTTDIDISGKDATVTAQANPTVNATVTDIDIAGQPATPSTATNVTVNATVTDIDITGKDATVTAQANININITVTNIDIAGQAATITTEINSTINAIVTDIDIAGISATVIAEQNISQTTVVTDVAIQAFNPIVTAGGSVFIPTTLTNTDIDGQTATVSAEVNTTVNVTVTDISIIGFGAQNPYTSAVGGTNPIHWWRVTTTETGSSIVDYGSGNKTARAVNKYWDGTTKTVNLGSSSFKDPIPGDIGSKSIELVGINTPTSGGDTYEYILFDSQPTFLGDNLSYGFWVKTASLNNELMIFDSPDRTTAIDPIPRISILGTINGYLATWQLDPNILGKRNIVTSNTYICDDSWHYVVLTKEKTDSIFLYHSYVDGEEMSTVMSIGSLLTYAEYYSPTSLSYGAVTVYNIGSGSIANSYSIRLDNITINSALLSPSEITNIYTLGAGTEETVVNATVTDIDVTGSTTSTSITVNVTKSNTNIRARSPQISDGTNVIIISNQNNIAINGKAISITLAGSKTIYQTAGEISVDAQETRIRTRVVNFKFIPSTDTSLSAAGAAELTELDFLALLYNQTKKLLFRIGNTDIEKTSFIISIATKNTDILNAISLSSDNITYSNTLTIENLNPNSVTECIYVKFDSNQIDLLGAGTFLINVEKI